MKLHHLYALAERLKEFDYITRARRVEDNVIELAVKGAHSRHSGLDPESPRSFRDDQSLRNTQGILNQVQDDGEPVIPDPIQNPIDHPGKRRSRTTDHGIVGIGGTRPTYSLFFDMTRGNSTVYLAPSQRPLQGYNAPFDTLLHTLVSSARILDAQVVNDDRILRIDLAPKSDYKDQRIALQFEFTGKNTNAILLDENNVIIEALRHIDAESSFRVIRPGVELVPLPPRAQANSHSGPDPESHQTTEGILNQVQDDANADLPRRSESDPESLRSGQRFQSLNATRMNSRPHEKEKILNHVQDDTQTTHYPLPTTHSSPIDSILIENHRERHARKLAQAKQSKASAVRKQIQKFDRLLKKLADPDTLMHDAERYQNMANILLANLHTIRPYDRELKTTDFDGNPVTIPLPPDTPVGRMSEHYFTRAKRARAKAANIHIERENLESKKSFYENILHAIEQAQDVRELDLLVPKRARAQRKKERLKEGELFWIEDVKVYVGRNSVENQHLLGIAKANDIWMHVRDIPSSHVIIRTDKQTLPDRILEAAAKLCVDFSIRQPGDYEVDYTRRKFVKIQEGSRVEYDKYQTIRVRKEGVEIRN